MIFPFSAEYVNYAKKEGLKMKVYRVSREDYGAGYIVVNPMDFKDELEEEIKEVKSMGETAGFKKEEIEPFLAQLKEMPVGAKSEIGVYGFEVLEMDEDEFSNLREFGGW